MRSNALAGQPELDPISPERLEIASLARGLGTTADDGRTAGDRAVRLSVGLNRDNLGTWQQGGYFTLKMLMVRALRRGLKNAIIEVDDVDGEVPAEAPFEISLEPDDPKALARATRTVNRVIRSRRWRTG
jgi:hypothetical protein